MDVLPEVFNDNAQFKRYYETWCENEASIVFVPMAEMLREEGLIQEACDVCEKSLRYHQGSISGRLLLASLYWDLGKKKKADQMAREILNRMPDHAGARKFLTGGKGPKRKPDNPLHTTTMVEVLVRQGAYQDASVVLRDLIRADPTNQDLRKRLAEVEEQLSGEEKTVTEDIRQQL